MNKTSEVSFKTLIDPLCLAIGLWVISTTHAQINIKKFEKFLPKVTGEHLISVRHYGCGQAMELKNVVQEQLSYLEGSKGWDRAMK
jgi:hypothetical protein